MFAYCENNPVNRSDPNGEWFHLVVGAAAGIASQYACDVVANLCAGASWSEALKAQSTIAEYAGAAVSGALAASGVGIVGTIVGNALISSTVYLANCDIKGETVSLQDWGETTLTAAISGIIGGEGANGKKLIGIVNRSRRVLKTAVAPKKISMYRGKIRSSLRKTAISVGRTVLSFLFANRKKIGGRS